ncbi:MAG: glycosyltransferase [Brasilonema octagenarum HA4186-MV1]|jgi:glycosyltransferase involved in cell wall biosynthesis|uniref:Glycosyltransferase family 2 protein n=2 Tax=Brasilonema TaxID=383614 RepID=A0A856MI97_9CYAN|nr:MULTISPECIES: glycosyltransferase family 2 protein [Brasilonema]MBW4629121.1 glycosyltransferase [Brasilonema octagenarum HA4186-MV1]NMF64655.1 glycosyltransferase family 2 protein [Brasilonema octagenarum UFV-OR1]QDL08867.1 glycosyltransferase family 2 protein [Brasilonema sennae CENA114]QDL15224.1 glycosyltransferase family 2 protein [Brasilonema octagenarum UFV-E1]
MLISVCVSTYQRPEGLKRLLDGLNQLTFSKCETPNLEVIVVDNDSTGSASALCSVKEKNFNGVLKYSIEPTRGISNSRNKALACINKDTNFVAFIDDDEVPASSWLDELLFVQQKLDADVVTGPVFPHFTETDVPNWVLKGKFFEPTHFPTGHPLKVAFTNNVLIRFEILRQIHIMFDERFALSGGEDSHFFMRLSRAGYKIVWADTALVYEWIPQNRTKMKWILRRGYRCWSTQSLCERELYPSIMVLSIRACKGIGLISQGFCLLLPSLVLGQHAIVKALLHICRGTGTLAGLAGVRYQEYKVISGIQNDRKPSTSFRSGC